MRNCRITMLTDCRYRSPEAAQAVRAEMPRHHFARGVRSRLASDVVPNLVWHRNIPHSAVTEGLANPE